MALTYGETEVIFNENGVVVIGRKYFDSQAIIVFNKNTSASGVTVELPKHFQSDSYKKLSYTEITSDGKSVIVSGSAGYEIFYR
jgi:non-canonical (house-cleaning) NTP pyrophosphatase